MIDTLSVTNFVSYFIDTKSDELFTEVNEFIYKNPELNYEEHKAHAQLTKYLRKTHDWKVTESAFGIETSFVAVFQHKAELSSKVVSFNAEYDALPDIGHACGHNLIATGAVAAALATAAAMKEFDIAGTVKLFGTPAEEAGGGKVKMIQAGAYDDVDVSLMHHAMNGSGHAFVTTAASFKYTVEYFGKSAHAAAAPWQGINALDAASIYMHASALHRQHFEEGDRIHSIIAQGGSAANVIPDYTKIEGNVRAKNRARMVEMKKKVVGSVKAGAIATGCTYKINYLNEYDDMLTNVPLSNVFRRFYDHFSEQDGTPKLSSLEYEKTLGTGGSTDQGNVSWIIPALHTTFDIGAERQPHTIEFCEAAGRKSSHIACLKSAKCLSLAGLEVLYNDDFFATVKSSWKMDVENLEPKNVDLKALDSEFTYN